MRNACAQNDVEQNPALKSALLHYLADTQNNRPIRYDALQLSTLELALVCAVMGREPRQNQKRPWTKGISQAYASPCFRKYRSALSVTTIYGRTS